MQISLISYQEMCRVSKENGDLLDQTLYRLCDEHPWHRTIDEISAKNWLIGRGFATGVERLIRSSKTQGSSLWKMVLHMKKHGKLIDQVVGRLRRMREPLSVEKLQVILAEHGSFCRVVSRITYNKQSLVSFASKYLHFHAPIVPIYDSWVGHQAWRMRRKHDLDWFKRPKEAVDAYYWYCVCFWQLYTDLRHMAKTVNVRQVESYLMWLANGCLHNQRDGLSAGFGQLGRKQSKVFAHFQLHTIHFCQEPGCRQPVIGGVGLYFAEVRQLGLKKADSLLGRRQFLVVSNHDASGIISTIPRRPSPRFTCQYSIVFCSPSKAARRRSQKTLAPKIA
jgi:hypothetical protein